VKINEGMREGIDESYLFIAYILCCKQAQGRHTFLADASVQCTWVPEINSG